MIHGVDLSCYQAVETTDYGELARAIAFAYVKATDAETDKATGAWVPTVDPLHEKHTVNLRARGIPTGSYCFGHPTQDAISSAVFFILHAWFDQLRPVLDMESLRPDKTIPSNAGVWCRRWIDHVRANTGTNPIIYASANYAVAMLQQCPDLAKEDWWIAAYPGDAVHAPDHMPVVPGLLKARVLAWQWTGLGRLPGIKGNADRDIAPSIEPLYVEAPLDPGHERVGM